MKKLLRIAIGIPLLLAATLAGCSRAGEASTTSDGTPRAVAGADSGGLVAPGPANSTGSGGGAGESRAAGSEAAGTKEAIEMKDAKSSGGAESPADAVAKVVRSEDEWKKTLTAEQYDVLRKKGTERAFTGKYWNTKTPGKYVCAGCGQVLFTSDQKFDSGCGWPSFSLPADQKAVDEHSDTSHGMVRTEVVCSRCGGHLGHVFEDGPGPSHLRYCINSASIDLKDEDTKKDK